ncbi:hypothetical protein BDA96_08G197700 [Sorghum bicolor]|uniref:Uncharacterized protein n=1 Tax=Sorghum bicolor TaxID=4558 RepID=A0A921U839_SORBI|nr:hypothetical protein BDA96_08G197700 [Sorghum bicolor]
MPPQMSRQAAARPAEARSVRRPSSSSPSRKRPSSSSSSSSSSNDSSSSDVLVDEVLLDDPTDERIEAEIVAHLFRGADPEAYRQAVAQQESLRAKKAALRREVAESRALTRRLRAYTDLLKTDVTGYSEAQTEEYRRELQRRSKECFGRPLVLPPAPAMTPSTTRWRSRSRRRSWHTSSVAPVMRRSATAKRSHRRRHYRQRRWRCRARAQVRRLRACVQVHRAADRGVPSGASTPEQGVLR